MKRKYKIAIFTTWTLIALTNTTLLTFYAGTIIGYLMRNKI